MEKDHRQGKTWIHLLDSWLYLQKASCDLIPLKYRKHKTDPNMGVSQKYALGILAKKTHSPVFPSLILPTACPYQVPHSAGSMASAT